MHDGVVTDRDDAAAGVAVQVAEGVELFQVDGRDAGFLLEGPQGGFIDRFLAGDGAAWEGPPPPEGRCRAFHQEDLERLVLDGEERDVHRDDMTIAPLRWKGRHYARPQE